MSEKEYKIKCENLFKKNTVLINQQKIDAEQIRALQKQNGELTDKMKELEAQIKKMKRCEICKHYQLGSCNYHSNWVKDCKKNGMKLFELKEIKEND